MMVFKCDRCKTYQESAAVPITVEVSKGFLKERLLSIDICKECYDEILPILVPKRRAAE